VGFRRKKMTKVVFNWWRVTNTRHPFGGTDGLISISSPFSPFFRVFLVCGGLIWGGIQWGRTTISEISKGEGGESG